MTSWYESLVDRQIREAQERGEFDNLPGAGKPLDLSDTGDPDWWVKRFAARENIDLGGALPGALAISKEATGYPEEWWEEPLTDNDPYVRAGRS